MAVLAVDDPMTSLREASDDNLPLMNADGELHFVAIVPRRCCAQCFFDRDMRQFSDMRHSVHDLETLCRKLCFVGKVLELTAAAVSVDLATRAYAVDARGANIHDTRARVGLFYFFDTRGNLLARQCVRHEYGEVIVPADAFTRGAETFYPDVVILSLLYGYCRLHSASLCIILYPARKTSVFERVRADAIKESARRAP